MAWLKRANKQHNTRIFNKLLYDFAYQIEWWRRITIKVKVFMLKSAEQQHGGAHFRIMADKSEATLASDDLEDILYLVEGGFLDNDDDFRKEIEEIAAEVP